MVLIGYAAAWIKSARGSTKSRKPASSGANKRKAEAEANEAASESDEGFEKMDIVDDNGAEVELIEQERESTPDKSDVDATDDEEDSILDSVAAPRSKYSGLNSTTKASATETAKTPGTQIKTASPPPPRELPFIRKPGVAEVANNDDEVETEGETDDDEL